MAYTQVKVFKKNGDKTLEEEYNEFCKAEEFKTGQWKGIGTKITDGCMYIFYEIKSEKIEFCPECKNKLIVRTGKVGNFMGCSNYPTCKYTKTIK